MDIITHTLSGIAIGTVLAGFSKNNFSEKSAIVAFSGFGGMFPDFDAISLWSGFDKTFGRILHLIHSGKEIYFSKLWYSHHGFNHSLFAALFFAFLSGILLLVFHKKRYISLENMFKQKYLLLSGFIIGFVLHLLEDMPTPASVWGGVNFFWPLKHYTGGTGKIWWWNNYDIFLIVLCVIVLNIILLSLKKLNFSKVPLFVFFTGFLLCVYQIQNRSFNFNYSGQTIQYAVYEQKSKDIQKEILGDKLFLFMSWFDNKLKINF